LLTVVLRFHNGILGAIDNSREAADGYDQRVEILHSEGKIETGMDGGFSALMAQAARESYDEYRPVRLEEVNT
jgi:myo-inositol 2-dehydrogenase/D-chiro-inositol 1-dehydrogenase